jgi:hypothetical protein
VKEKTIVKTVLVNLCLKTIQNRTAAYYFFKADTFLSKHQPSGTKRFIQEKNL